MSKTINEITDCIRKELEDFEQMFSSCFSSEDSSSLDSMLRYIVSLKGKRLRPILTILSALTFGKATSQTYRAAIIVELLHTASLLHDDVIDESSLRRGKKTLNALEGNHSAVLVGDYLYGKALSLLRTQEDFNLMPIYAKIAIDLPQGELREDEATQNRDTSIEFYLRVIYEKTASLIEAAILCGVSSCGNKDCNIDDLHTLGKALGMAFQIKDDILDYQDNTGKEKGIDIKECKITLPLIYYMETISEKEKQDVLSILYSAEKEEEQVQSLLHKVNNSEALQRAEETMLEYMQQAVDIIATLPKNIYSESLSDLVQYLINRNK